VNERAQAPSVIDSAAEHPGVIDTAAEHVTANVPRASRSSRAGDVRQALEGRSFDTVADVAVLDDAERLVGLLPIERLFEAADDTPVAAIWTAIRRPPGRVSTRSSRPRACCDTARRAWQSSTRMAASAA
jgi:hypothetical protein